MSKLSIAGIIGLVVSLLTTALNMADLFSLPPETREIIQSIITILGAISGLVIPAPGTKAKLDALAARVGRFN